MREEELATAAQIKAISNELLSNEDQQPNRLDKLPTERSDNVRSHAAKHVIKVNTKMTFPESL